MRVGDNHGPGERRPGGVSAAHARSGAARAFLRAAARGGGVAAVVVAVVLALLAAAPATETGTRWILAGVDRRAGDRVRIGEVSGRLTHTVRVRDFGIRHPSFDLTAATLELALDPAKLLAGEMHLNALAMDGVRIALPEAPASTDAAPGVGPGPAAGPAKPITPTGSTQSAEPIAPAGPAQSTGSVTPAGSDQSAQSTRSVTPAEPIAPAGPAQSTGSVTPAGSDQSAQSAKPITPAKPVQPAGPALPAWPVLRVAAPAVTATNVTVVVGGEEVPVESVTFSTHLTETRLTLADLNLTGPTWRLAANGTMAPVAPFGLDLQAQWTSHADGATHEGRLTMAGNAQSLDFDAAMQAPVELRSSGRWRRTAQGYELEARGAWQDLRWPLIGPPSVRSPEGRFELGGGLDALRLALDLDLAADRLPAMRIALEGTGSVEPSAALPFALTARWRAATAAGATSTSGATAGSSTRAHWRAVTASATTLSGALDASGDLGRVVLRPSVISPFSASADATLSLGDASGFEAVARWNGLFWPLAGAPMVTSPRGRLEARGTTALAKLDLTAALEAPDRVRDAHVSASATVTAAGETEVTGSFAWGAQTVSREVRLRGAGTVRGNPSGALRFTHALSAPFAVSSTGEIRPADPAPELRMVSEWTDLRWPPNRPVDETMDGPLNGPLDGPVNGPLNGTTDGPLNGPAALSSSHGALALNGPLDALEIQLDGALETETLPPAHITLTGVLDDAGLDLEPLLIRALAGQTTARGRIGWRPEIGWDLEVDARGLDPGRHWSQWNGTLDASAVVRGRMADGAPHATVDIRKLQGRLRDHPVAGRGTVAVAGGRLSAQGVSLRSGDNRLALEGMYDHHREMDLAFSLDAPDLSAVLPDAQGRLSGEGELRGAVASPRMTMRLAGRDLHYRDWSARRATIEAEIADAQSKSQVVVQVGEARAGAHRIGSVELRADGALAAHSAHATATSSLGDLDLRLAGGMAAGRWRGELAEATFTAAGGETWRLADASEFGVDADRLRIGTTCLKSGTGARACADFERTDRIQSRFGIESLPLSALRPWLPAESSLTGALDVEGAGSLDGGRLEGRIAARVSPGELTVPLGQGEPLAVAHADTALNITVEASRTEMDFRSVLGGDGPVQGRLRVEGRGREASLDGAINVSLPRLDPIAAFVAGPLSAEGEAFVEARIGGTVGAPRALGVARVEIDGARVHDLGIELSDSHLEARADDAERIAIGGVLRSGDGHLGIDGSGRLGAEARWTAEDLAITGESFEIVRLPEAVVTISPDVTIAAAGETLEISGRVVVPQARITPRERTEGVVDVSADEVLVSRTGAGTGTDSRGEPPADSRTGSRDDSRDDSQAGSRTDSQAESRTDSRDGSRTESQADSRVDSRTESQANSRAESLAGSRDESQVNSRASSRADSRDESEAESRADSRADPNPEPEPESGRGPDVGTDLLVVLGDEVVFDGYGLLSRLTGELRVRQTPGGVLEGFGTLDLTDGRFTLYGQELDIEHGRVTFAGPLDDPGIDIRAVRRAGDITAGITIGGTISTPRSRAFSEPPLAEPEALSLVLTGRTLSSAGERETALLSQAALRLGLEGTRGVGARLRSDLGLDELSVDVGGVGDTADASLILGKRLSADFGVRYVHSLVRRTGSVFVDYRLTDHLGLEVESGERHGLDLLFSVERDGDSR